MGWGARKRMSTRKKRVEREGGSSGSTLLNAANSRPSQAPANLISFLLCFLCFSLFSRGRAGDRNKRYKTKGRSLSLSLSGLEYLCFVEQVNNRVRDLFFSPIFSRGERLVRFSSDLLRSIVSSPCYRRSAPRRVVASCRLCHTRMQILPFPVASSTGFAQRRFHPMLPSEGLFDNDDIVFTFREREVSILLRDENYAMRNYTIFEIGNFIILNKKLINR